MNKEIEQRPKSKVKDLWIEKENKPAMETAYLLKDWYIRVRKGEDDKPLYHVTGRVYGRPGWDDGKKMLSSEIRRTEITDDAVIIHTQNSSYRCPVEEHRYPPKNGDLLIDLLGADEAGKIEAASKKRFDRYQQELAQQIPKSDNDALLFVMSSRASYYFESLLIRKDKRIDYTTDSYVHSGQFQDSVIIGDMEKMDYRFFPYKGNRLKFYAWDDGHGDVYVYNSGKDALEVDCPAGFFLIRPGEIELMSEDNKKAQIQEHIAPAIDRYSIWDAHVDEDGTVYYT